LNQPATDPLPIWEITSVIISCLIAEWIVAAFGNYSKNYWRDPGCLRVRLDHFSRHHEREETAADIGFRFDNFWPAVKLLFWPTTLVVIAILGRRLVAQRQRIQAGSAATLRFIGLPLWALFQQYALQGSSIAALRLRFGPGSKSILLVAIILAWSIFPILC